MADEWYGGPPETPPEQARDSRNDIQEWRDSAYENREEERDDFAEAMEDLGGVDEELVASGLMSEGGWN